MLHQNNLLLQTSYKCLESCDFTTSCPDEMIQHKFNCVPFVMNLQMGHWDDFVDSRSVIRMKHRRAVVDSSTTSPLPESLDEKIREVKQSQICVGCNFMGDSEAILLNHKANCDQFFVECLLGQWVEVAEKNFGQKTLFEKEQE